MSAHTNKHAYEEGIEYASKLSLQDLEYSMNYVTGFENRMKIIIGPLFPIDKDPRRDRAFGEYFTALVLSDERIGITSVFSGTCIMNEYFRLWEYEFIKGVRNQYQLLKKLNL